MLVAAAHADAFDQLKRRPWKILGQPNSSVAALQASVFLVGCKDVMVSVAQS
jgi:hypothetical protein